MAKSSSKVIKPIVRSGCFSYVFDNLNQAADAIKFFGKLKPVRWKSNPENGGGHYAPDTENDLRIELETRFEYRETEKLIGLPAPKRGTVQCTVCESVAVKPGRACESCGTIAPLL